MNFKNLILIVTGLLLLIAPLTLAANGIFLTKTVTNYFLETDTALPAVFNVYNSNGFRVCFASIATISPDDADLIVAPPSFCLNAQERTPVTVTVNATSNTDSGNYSLNLRLDSDNNGFSDQNSVSIHVNQTHDIDLDLPTVSLCKNESKTETVSVRNNTGQAQHVRLETSTNGLGVRLSQIEFDLSANQSKDITMHFEVPTSKNSGTYKYEVFAHTATSSGVQKGEFKVRTCDSTDDFTTNFSISTSNTCQLIAPGQTKVISFNLQNKNDSLDLFSFSAQSALPITLLTNSPVELDLDESQGISVRVSPGYTVSNGRYFVTLTVNNGTFSRTKDACIDVGQESAASISPNNLSVIRTQSVSTVLTVKNNSANTKSIQISTDQTPIDTTVSFSQTNFSLSGNRSQNVIVTIQTNSNTALGNQSSALRVRIGDQTHLPTVNFTVLAESTPPQPPQNGPVEGKIVEIISYPSVIEISGGETKELDFIVQNNGNNRLNNLDLFFFDLPSGISFAQPARFSLDTNQIVHLRGQLLAANNISTRSINVRLVAQNSDVKNTQIVHLAVLGTGNSTGINQQSSNPFEFVITGLFGIGAGWQGWLALLLLVLIVFMLLSESHEHAAWIGAILLVVLFLVILTWDSAYAPWVLLAFLIIVFLLAIYWSKKHDLWHSQRHKWRQTVRGHRK